MGLTTQITGGPVATPGGEPLPNVAISITLVDAVTLLPVSAVDVPTSAVRIGTLTTQTDASALVDFVLWPNSRGNKSTVYSVLIGHAEVRPFHVSVAENDSGISWLEFASSGFPSDETALQQHMADGTLHLSADEDDAMSAANSPAAGNPFATIADVVAAGGGDMHSLVYDPTGVGADVFDLINSVGNLDGGVFT